jgi:protein SCO1
VLKSMVILLATLALLPALALAQANPPPPSGLEGVGIDEHLGAALPLDASFVDENGTPVKLGDYFGEKPVILNLIYFECPMLCSIVLNGMVEGLKKVDFVPGQDFEIVSVSFNPLETPSLALAKKQNYIKEYGVPQAAAGWHFLTGTQDSIDKLTGAVGFKYKWMPDTKQFAHAAAIYMITPAGKISRYLYGVEFNPQTLRLALVEAGQGKLGKTLDHMLLYCYHYDAASGRYAPAAMNIMRAGGVLMLIVLAAILLPVWFKSRKRHAKDVVEAGH